MGNRISPFYDVFGDNDLKEIIVNKRRVLLNYEDQLRRQEEGLAQIHRRLRARPRWGTPRCEEVYLGGTWVKDGKWKYVLPPGVGVGWGAPQGRNWNIDDW